MSDGLEDGNEDESTYTHEEDEFAQMVRNLDTTVAFGGTFDVSFQRGTHDKHRYHHADQRSDDGLDDDVDGSHLATDPQHDGRHVADGTPCTAGVGCEDDHSGIEPALFLVGDKFAQ